MPSSYHARFPAASAILVGTLLLTLAAPVRASAQSPPEERSPFTGDVSFGLTATEGNSQTLSLNFGGRVSYVVEKHTWAFSTNVLRTRDSGDVKANKGNVALRYDYEPSDRIYVTSQLAASYNRPAGIERRLSPGLGIGYDIVRAETTRLSLDGGLNWVGERFTDDTRESSVYFKLSQEFRLRVNETTDLAQRLSYSPRPENLSDYLIQGSLTLTTKVWKLLGIKTEISDDYDSTPFIDPDTGIARSSNDLTFITGLSVSF
jgi:putative salt-induced outer membrane protein YdiY